jgi:rod shape-determining protein MreB
MYKKMSGWLSNDVAIDLGTANTVVHVKGLGIVLNEPSVVAVDNQTRKVVAVGIDAKSMLGKTPDHITAVRPMKDGVIADFQVTEIMLREFIRKAQRKRRFVKPRIVICVPSGITEVEKRAVRDSAEHAGAREVFLVAEPIAAAIGVGLPVNRPSGNMIIDIGGGTTEIAVIALDGIVCDTSIRVGGDEMDESIITYIKKTYNLLVGDLTAENVKKTIGSAAPLPEELEMEIKGRDLVAGIPKTLRISSVEIREALREPIMQIVDALRLALERCPPELSADIVDRGIVMTGGGSLLRELETLLKEETNLPINTVDDPLSCVVLRACCSTGHGGEGWTVFRGLFGRYRDRTLLGLVAILSCLLLSLDQDTRLGLARQLGSTLYAPIQALAHSAEELVRLRGENRQLRRVVATLNLERQRLMHFRDEAAELRRVAGFATERFPWLQPCEIVGHSTDRFQSALQLSCGADDSLDVDMPVAAYAGLVGRVRQVTSTRSLVQTLASPDIAVSVIDERSNVVGILRWVRGNQFKLDRVDAVEDVLVGDPLVTSGLGGVYPRGIPVGVVSGVEVSLDGLFLQVGVRPHVDFAGLKDVFVVREVVDWQDSALYSEEERALLRELTPPPVTALQKEDG